MLANGSCGSSWHNPYEDALFALHYHRVNDFKAAVNALPTPAVVDVYKENLLHHSARTCNAEAANLLLFWSAWRHCRPDINAQNIRGETPLHVALEAISSEKMTCAREAAEVALMLLDAGAHLFVSDVRGTSPFGFVGKMTKCPEAVMCKMYQLAALQYEDVPRLMVDHGWSLAASFHLKSTGITQRMLELCPELVQPNKNGEKPNELLHLAIDAGCKGSILQTLLVYGGLDVNARFGGQTPLQVAALKNIGSSCYLHMKILLEAGANPKVTDNLGLRPLHYTVHKSSSEVFELLIAAESQSPRDSCELRMPYDIHLAAANGYTRIMRHLLIKTNLDSRCYFKMTPLHYAARERNTAAVYYLLAVGAKVDAVDNKGWSALHHAVHGPDEMKEGNVVPVIGLLLHFGADINQCSRDRSTPLDTAVERQNKPAIYLLIRHLAIHDTCSEQVVNQTLINKYGDLLQLQKKCLRELTLLLESYHANYLPMLRYNREELIMVARGKIQQSYLELTEEGVKFTDKNFSPNAFPIYGNFLLSRIHHANLELMTFEEIRQLMNFNALCDSLAFSANEFVEFFKEEYLV